MTECVAEVTKGKHKGLCVFSTCLEKGNIDARLKKRIKRLNKEAEYLGTLIGKLQVPTSEEFEAKNKEYGEEKKRQDAGGRKRQGQGPFQRRPQGK